MRPLALVTGGSSGIGAAFARKLAVRGFDLVVVARRRDRLDELARELAAAGGASVEALAADLSTDEGVAATQRRIESAASLELLVNNAGFGTLGTFFEADCAPQEAMHRLHILATLRLTHAALRKMIPRARGAVINVSSVAGFAATPGCVGYCATKQWMNAFTEGLFQELQAAGSPVRVQALCPGYTLSEFHDKLRYDRGRIPRSLWLRADAVVERSLRGLERGELFVVPDWRYRLAVLLARHLPRRLLHAVNRGRQRRIGRLATTRR